MLITRIPLAKGIIPFEPRKYSRLWYSSQVQSAILSDFIYTITFDSHSNPVCRINLFSNLVVRKLKNKEGE